MEERADIGLINRRTRPKPSEGAGEIGGGRQGQEDPQGGESGVKGGRAVESEREPLDDQDGQSEEQGGCSYGTQGGTETGSS